MRGRLVCRRRSFKSGGLGFGLSSYFGLKMHHFACNHLFFMGLEGKGENQTFWPIRFGWKQKAYLRAHYCRG